MKSNKPVKKDMPKREYRAPAFDVTELTKVVQTGGIGSFGGGRPGGGGGPRGGGRNL